jgi:hypothetical protein
VGGGFTTHVRTTVDAKDLYDGLNYSAAAYFGKTTQLGLIADFDSLAAASSATDPQSKSVVRYGLTLRRAFGSGAARFEGGLAYAVDRPLWGFSSGAFTRSNLKTIRVFFSRTLHLHAERWRRDDLFYAISDD